MKFYINLKYVEWALIVAICVVALPLSLWYYALLCVLMFLLGVVCQYIGWCAAMVQVETWVKEKVKQLQEEIRNEE